MPPTQHSTVPRSSRPSLCFGGRVGGGNSPPLSKQMQCSAAATAPGQSLPNEEPGRPHFESHWTPPPQKKKKIREIGQGSLNPVDEAWGCEDLSLFCLSAASNAAKCDPTLMIRTGERLRSDRGSQKAVARARWPAKKRHREAYLVRDDTLSCTVGRSVRRCQIGASVQASRPAGLTSW